MPDMKSMEKSPPPTVVEITDAYEWNEIIDKVAGKDSLTGLPNRGVFDRVLSKELAKAKRYHHPLVVVMMDVNGFKQINDSYGHQNGDKVLVETAKIMKEFGLRETDFLARYGGDEFVMIMPETDQENAVSATERFLEAIATYPVMIGDKEIHIQLSIGIGEMSKTDTEATLLKKADDLLYIGKEQKNKGGAIAYQQGKDIGMIIVENHSVG